MCVCVCVRERERERVCVCVIAFMWGIGEGGGLGGCVWGEGRSELVRGWWRGRHLDRCEGPSVMSNLPFFVVCIVFVVRFVSIGTCLYSCASERELG